MATADSPQEPPPERPFLLPGDVVDHAYIPNASKRLRIGPGLRLVPPATLQCTVAGQLFADRRKNMLQIEGFNGKVSVDRTMTCPSQTPTYPPRIAVSLPLHCSLPVPILPPVCTSSPRPGPRHRDP